MPGSTEGTTKPLEPTSLPAIDKMLTVFTEHSEQLYHYITTPDARHLIRQEMMKAEETVRVLTRAYRINENLLLVVARCLVSFEVELREAEKVTGVPDLLSGDYTRSATITLKLQELLDKAITLHDSSYNLTEESVTSFMSRTATKIIMAAPTKHGKRGEAHKRTFAESAFNLRVALLDGFTIYEAAVEIVRKGGRPELMTLAPKIESERERIKALAV